MKVVHVSTFNEATRVPVQLQLITAETHGFLARTAANSEFGPGTLHYGRERERERERERFNQINNPFQTN